MWESDDLYGGCYVDDCRKGVVPHYDAEEEAFECDGYAPQKDETAAREAWMERYCGEK